MKSFLDQLAAQVLKSGKTDFSNLCIVLPNRRAGVFLRDALSKQGDRAIWAPKILSIEDFIFELSGYVKVDQISLLFTFYEVYKKHVSEPQPLEMFANWATTFLSDINEVDINLVDAEDIFNQLTSVERIAKWNPDGSEATDLQKRHIKFVESFSGLYSAVKEQLESENKAYQGMAFRKLAESAELVLKQCEWDSVWFAGFNALTVSEEAIIQTFSENETAQVFWDMDEFYANDSIHEAGFYIRKYQQGRGRLKLDSDINWNQNHLTTEPKEIHVVAAQRSVAQAEAAASILSKKLEGSESDTLSNTAVVLNDEKVLVPLLSNLPTQLTGVNITMGYGLRYSQSVVFLDKVFQLYSSLSTDGEFYHKHLMSVLTDGIYLSVAKADVSQVKKTLVSQKKVYLRREDLSNSEFDKVLFGLTDVSVASFLEHLKKVVAFIRTAWTGSSHILELKYLSLLERMLVRLTDLQSEFGGVDSLKTLQVFWRQLTNNQTLDFVGEPIGGLQIMGMLETRNLDFEELIILGVNEGSLPSNAHTPSNFTFDVRRVFGLACQNERDAVTAYHFYRLIQRAKKVYLIYDQDTTSFGGGEVSRYVQQLQNEAPPNISIKTWGVEQKLPKSESVHEISIPKGKEEIDKLVELGKRGFSPSALNTYRSCSLKFYFRYVAGFKEENILNEDVDHATFGTAVHDTLDNLYQPTIGKVLSEDDLNLMRTQMEAELTRQFAVQ
ncbi:MAG: PD-(D/E)XK nuclease family protein, partial [Flavobacteriales bacterium]